MTALTTNGSAAAATTLAAAGKLFNATGGTSGNTSTKVGTGTQFKQIFALGTATNQTGVASIPAPTDSNWHGWMWDVSTLEGQRLAAGTWTPTIHLLASTSTTITPTVEWYKRSSGGVYTSIGSVAGSSIALTTSSQALTFTPPSLALMDFATGDKLVMWLWVNQTAGGATNSTISVVEATSGSTSGVVSEAQTVTPGYGPSPVALTTTMVGTGTFTATWPPVYMILAQDTFTRANQSGWGTASDLETWASVRGTTTTSISSNEGLFAITGSTFGIMRLGIQSAANTEVLVRVKPGATASNTGAVARFVDSSNFYYSVLINNTLVIGKNVANVFTTLVSPAFTFSTANFYWIRFNLVGTTLNSRVWQDGTSEPTTWTASTTESTFTSGGYGLGVDSTTSAQFDQFTVDNTIIPLAVTMAGVGALTGTLSTSSSGVALAGECDGVGTFTISPPALSTSLTTTLPGVGVLTPALSANLALPSVTMAGVGTMTGTAQLSTALSAIFLGVGTLTETFTLTTALTTTLSGTGTLSGTLSASLTMPGATLVGVGTLSGAVTETTALAVTMAGVGTLSETATLTTALITTFAGVGTLTGTFSLSTALADTLAGIGTLTVTLSSTGGVSLSCTMAGIGVFTPAAPSQSTALSVTSAGTGTLSGTLSLSTSLVSTLAGSGTLSAAPTLNTSLASTFVGAGILASTLMLQTSLASTVAGVSTLSGAFSLQVALFLSCLGISTLSGTLVAVVVPVIVQKDQPRLLTTQRMSILSTRDGTAILSTRDGTSTLKERG